MSEKIKDFKQKHEPKYKLKKYDDEIQELLRDGYSQEQILFYLSEYQNVKVSLRTLTRQIAHIKKTNSKQTLHPQPVRTEKRAGANETKSKAGAVDYKLPPTESISELTQKMRERHQQ